MHYLTRSQTQRLSQSITRLSGYSALSKQPLIKRSLHHISYLRDNRSSLCSIWTLATDLPVIWIQKSGKKLNRCSLGFCNTMHPESRAPNEKIMLVTRSVRAINQSMITITAELITHSLLASTFLSHQ